MRPFPPAPHPWPRKPPRDVLCRAQVPCPTPEQCADERERMIDPGGTIHYHTCPNPATETCWWGHETWLCAEHAETLSGRGDVIRNPRRKHTTKPTFRTSRRALS